MVTLPLAYFLLVSAAAPLEVDPNSQSVVETKPPHFLAADRGDIKAAIFANPYSLEQAPNEWRQWLTERGYQTSPKNVLNPFTGDRYDILSGRVSVLVARFCAQRTSILQSTLSP